MPNNINNKGQNKKHSPSPSVSPSVQVPLPATIPWRLHTIILDGVDRAVKYDPVIANARAIIEANSKFRIQDGVSIISDVHTLTHYDCANGPQTCVVCNSFDLPQQVWDLVPVADSYLILWNALPEPPLQAGSTWGIANGVMKGGISRPYATVPVDPWWYKSDSTNNILTHELINCISCKIEVAPYNCPGLSGTPGEQDSYLYEKSRLEKLTDDTYRKYLELNPEL